MLRTTLMTLLFALATPAFAQNTPAPAPAAVVDAAAPTAAELMAAMDSNLQAATQKASVTMIVDDGRRTREFKMTSTSRGRHDSAMEYLEPSREKGTRMLKTESQMWLYLPRAERVQKISGHMMREGMMGSDVSYEDMMSDAEFDEMYDGKVVGSEKIDGRTTWKLEATAKNEDITYPKRMIWIDDSWRIPVKQELYALSGLLLKTWLMSDVKVIDGKNTPMKMVLNDALKEGSSTTVITNEVTFDVPLTDEVFSRRWLERGN